MILHPFSHSCPLNSLDWDIIKKWNLMECHYNYKNFMVKIRRNIECPPNPLLLVVDHIIDNDVVVSHICGD